jgi:hypothetical protein
LDEIALYEYTEMADESRALAVVGKSFSGHK